MKTIWKFELTWEEGAQSTSVIPAGAKFLSVGVIRVVHIYVDTRGLGDY